MNNYKMSVVTVYFDDGTTEFLNIDHDKLQDFKDSFGKGQFNLQNYCNGFVWLNVSKVKMLKYAGEVTND
jgi:hypothetical protein